MTSVIPDMSKALGTEAECLHKLQKYFRDADMHPSLPLQTSEVVELLRAGGGFDVNEDLLKNWATNGMVPNVLRRDDALFWKAENVLCAAIHADTWRRWIPMDKRHVHKMSAIEVAEAEAQQNGESCFTDLDRCDCASLVTLLAQVQDQPLKETLAVALRTKLRDFGVLDK